MDKEYFVSINDVSKRLSVPAHTLRYWEKQFPTAVRPITGAGGRRYYRPETLERLIIIRDLLYKNGLTIAGVKKLLHDGKFPRSAAEYQPEPADNITIVPQKQTTKIAPAEPVKNPVLDNVIDTALDLLRGAKQTLINQ